MKHIIEHFGSLTKMAAALDCNYQTIQHWIKNNRVPVNRAIQIEAITEGRITRRALRPDIFD